MEEERSVKPAFKWCGYKTHAPPRKLLELVAVLPTHIQKTISPDQKYLKSFAKLPLFFFTASAGLNTGVNLTLFKVAGVAIKNDEDWMDPFVISCISAAITTAWLTVFCLNQAMSLYA